MSVLDALATEVAEDQAAIDGDLEDTRTRVIRMGRVLRKMQKEQKKEQIAAKEQGEEPTPWLDWLDAKKADDQLFPGRQKCQRYALISKYPKSYTKSMSIDQAYREAGKWKRNGGDPPIKEKKTVSRVLGLIGKAAGQLDRKIETLADRIAESDVSAIAQEDKWTDEEIEGTREAVDDARKSCLMLIRQLDLIYEDA